MCVCVGGGGGGNSGSSLTPPPWKITSGYRFPLKYTSTDSNEKQLDQVRTLSVKDANNKRNKC